MSNKILIIENDAKISNYLITSLLRGIETVYDITDQQPTVITKASQSVNEIATAFQTHEVIAFQTSLVRESAYIAPAITKLLSAIKEEKKIYIMCDNFEKHFLRIIEDYADTIPSGKYDPMLVDDPINKLDMLLSTIAHHKIYECCDNVWVDFTKAKERFNQWEKRRLDYLASIKNNIIPNKKVKLKDLTTAPRFAREILTTGDIVDTYDCSRLEKNKNSGVWVMVGDKPVKLLNDRQYNEFEFVTSEEQTHNLVEVLIKSTDLQYRSELSNKDILFIEGLIGSDELSSMEKANIFCEELDIEKRGNRQIISNLLKTK